MARRGRYSWRRAYGLLGSDGAAAQPDAVRDAELQRQNADMRARHEGPRSHDAQRLQAERAILALRALPPPPQVREWFADQLVIAKHDDDQDTIWAIMRLVYRLPDRDRAWVSAHL